MRKRTIAVFALTALFSTLAFTASATTTTAAESKASAHAAIVASFDEPLWIGCSYSGDVLNGDTALPARYLRREFGLDAKVKKAVLEICGLGLYDAWINGVHISEGEELAPTVSDYDKRVYYNEFDVTKALRKGENAIAVTLGCGRYQSMRSTWIDGFGIPRLWCRLSVELKDGSTQEISSDRLWKITCEGPVRSNNEFDGEVYDARREFPLWTKAGFDDSAWEAPSEMSAPKGKLCPQPNPNIAVQDRLTPLSVTKRGETYILDMGQNMVGRLQISSRGLQSGDTLKLRFAETLKDDGSLYTANLRSAKATDLYIARDSRPFTWHPQFVYHGFRYVEVTGLKQTPKAKDFEGQVMYDRMEVTGTFETSNDVINTVYRNAYWGIRGNYRGMPTDCPQRDERMGWLGDRTAGCYGESYMFNNHALYSKWATDIEDAQREDGCIPDVCPHYWNFFSDNMTWAGAFLTVCDMLRWRFDDPEPIRVHYAAMKKWLNHMQERYLRDGIMTKDRYGDWCMPPESLELIHSKDPARITAAPLLSTPFYYHFLGMMQEFAPIAGHPEDIETFRAQAEESKRAFNEKYFNASEGYYGNNTVTANMLPLYFGMVPQGMEEKVFANIVHKTEVECDSHVSCGVVGMMVFMRTLTEWGRPDLALKIASNTTYPSWGYMAENGATTIWELWNGNTAAPDMNSGNHVMILGDLLTWFYEYLGGIRPETPGYKSIVLKPYPIEGLDWVNCSYNSVSGKIVSRWKRDGEKFIWSVEIPKGTSAKALVPGKNGTREERILTPGRHRIVSNL